MIKPKVSETKIVIGPCRLGYTHVFSKFNPDGDDRTAKYMTNVLIPMNEKETVEAVQKAIGLAKQKGIAAKWGGKVPKNLDLPLRDGDDKDPDKVGDTYQGMYYVNAKSSTRPGVVDRNGAAIMDEEEIYSGVWAIVSMTFYPYDSNGKRGVACGLNNIMKFKDDEKLGGRCSAETDFADIDYNDDDL